MDLRGGFRPYEVMSVTTPTTICIFTLCLKQRAEASGLGPAAYAPIAKAFSNLPEEEREREATGQVRL